jgi:signal transduction histidine kinase
MSPLDSGLLPKNKIVTQLSTLARRFTIAGTPGRWLNRITRRWSIHKKIGCGYVLAIGIAVLGTGVGLTVGEYYDDKAVGKFRITQKRYELMDHLEKAVLEVKVHQQRVIATPENDVRRQQYEVIRLLESINEARQLIFELKSNLNDERGHLTEDAAKSKTLLQTYNIELKLYSQLVQSLSEKIDTDNPESSRAQVAKPILMTILKGELAPKFEQLSDSLEKLVNSNVEQRQQAEAAFRSAKLLRVLIIVASMALSIAIAAVLAFYISRAIARPIKDITNVARRATQEGNFDLQAPVTTDNEIGVLGTSLNQLIQQVARQIRELKQAQAQLIQNEKMSSLGQMVAGLAHEINNPVNFIYANLEFVNNYTQELLDLIQMYQKSHPQPEAEIRNKLEEIDIDFLNEDLPKIMSSMHVGAERIQKIILSLRNFCHLDEAEQKKVDIHEGIENTFLILSHRVNQGVEVIKQYGDLPLVDCYPAQLNQVFMNILTNALDELLDDNKLSRKQILIQTKLSMYNQIEVRIRDNGSGIAPEIKDKIFDPFFTTKPVGKGTGMGLAICYQIIEKHRGKIDVISEFGRGAEFIVTLPVEQSLAETVSS